MRKTAWRASIYVLKTVDVALRPSRAATHREYARYCSSSARFAMSWNMREHAVPCSLTRIERTYCSVRHMGEQYCAGTGQ